jgi:hypothetical protein
MSFRRVQMLKGENLKLFGLSFQLKATDVVVENSAQVLSC